MHDFHAAHPVVVGIDGSQAALGAAVWAAREAVARKLPLKLVSVIYNAELLGADTSRTADRGADQLAAARSALAEARRAVAATTSAIAVETEVLWGNPLATLIELSRSAAMVCVGAIGVEHACHRAGSTAAALAGSASCPVAVIRRADAGHPPARGCIVAEADGTPENSAVLGWAMAEAGLRDAPLRVIAPHRPRPGAADEDDSAVRAQLARRIEHWARRFPQVAAEPVVVHGDVADYLVEHAGSIQLFVSGTRDRRSLGWPGDAGGCSVLTVGGTHL